MLPLSTQTYIDVVREVQHIVEDVLHQEHQTEQKGQHSNSNGKVAAIIIEVIKTDTSFKLIRYTAEYDNRAELE